VPVGSVTGLLGSNGAGKSTLIKSAVGLVKPNSGRVTTLGLSAWDLDADAKARLGYVPQAIELHGWMRVRHLLDYTAGFYPRWNDELARSLLAGWDVPGDRKVKTLSPGTLQKLAIVLSLAHEPELLILDEPMSGLDPFGRRDVRELILEQRDRGTTVLFSSHILPDVEILCDRVAIILKGVLTRIATVGELVQGSQQKIEIRCAGGAELRPPPELAAHIEQKQRPHETVMTVDDEQYLHGALAWLIASGADVRAVTPQRSTLEELFMATAEQVGVTTESRRVA